MEAHIGAIYQIFILEKIKIENFFDGSAAGPNNPSCPEEIRRGLLVWPQKILLYLGGILRHR